MIHGCFTHLRIVHPTDRPAWNVHRTKCPPLCFSTTSVRPPFFEWLNHRIWLVGLLNKAVVRQLVHHGCLPKLSVELNLKKCFTVLKNEYAFFWGFSSNLHSHFIYYFVHAQRFWIFTWLKINPQYVWSLPWASNHAFILPLISEIQKVTVWIPNGHAKN